MQPESEPLVSEAMVARLRDAGLVVMPITSLTRFADTIAELRATNAALMSALQDARRLWERAGNRN